MARTVERITVALPQELLDELTEEATRTFSTPNRVGRDILVQWYRARSALTLNVGQLHEGHIEKGWYGT